MGNRRGGGARGGTVIGVWLFMKGGGEVGGLADEVLQKKSKTRAESLKVLIREGKMGDRDAYAKKRSSVGGENATIEGVQH